jgi:hypothetical protein
MENLVPMTVATNSACATVFPAVVKLAGPTFVLDMQRIFATVLFVILLIVLQLV